MAGMLGMNIEQVKGVAKEVKREAAELQSKVNNIGNKITNAEWKGPDKEKFVAEWNTHKTQVTKCVEMLNKTASDMERNAREQETTSGR